MVEFQFPEDLTPPQKSVVSFMIERAKQFDGSNVISLAEFLTDGKTTLKTAVFRQSWLDSYKAYVDYRVIENFVDWFEKKRMDCAPSNGKVGSESCIGYANIRHAIVDSGLSTHAKIISELSPTSFEAEYLIRKKKIVELWKFYMNSEASIGGAERRIQENLDLLTNYTFDNSLRTFSALAPSLFIGLGWGATIDESGKSRERVGAATYNWNSSVNEMFFYLVSPKRQSSENLDRGYGQLKLVAGDSGSMLLAGGLPMAVLATVDGEKTSGGASVLPLPSPTSDGDNSASTGELPFPESNAVSSNNGNGSGSDSTGRLPVSACL